MAILQKFIEPTTCMEFVLIPSGTFIMGSPDNEEGRFNNEGPLHEVYIDNFWMAKYPVTNAQYRKYVPTHDSGSFEGHSLNEDNQPAVCVSWNEAKKFINWLTICNENKHEFRFPTEAEWEYACRAGSHTPFYFGRTITATQVNYDGTYIYGEGKEGLNRKYTTPVGSFPPNKFGLFDMHGNVWERCEDVYASNAYIKHQSENPLYIDNISNRVERGGSWGFGPEHSRSASRDGCSQNLKRIYIGFRVAISYFS